MINSQKKSMKVLFTISLVLLAVSLLLSIMKFFLPEFNYYALSYFDNSFGVLAILVAFIYVLGGYKKNDAAYYKIFMILVCITNLFVLITDLITTQSVAYASPISGLLRTVVLVNLVILSFAKDLGKNTSIGLASGVFGISLINLIRLAILYSQFNMIIVDVVGTSLAFLVLLLVIGKYMDKTERGTK